VKAAKIEMWIWILVYLGMILFGLGLSVLRADSSLGWGIAALGFALGASGVALIYVRSRMNTK
jgi:hypothetical protein